MVSERYHQKLFQNNESFAFLPGFLAVIGSLRLGQRSRFQEEVLHLVRYLSARDFIYPKILFHWSEEETMLFQTKLVILGKAVYQSAFLAFEN